MQSILRPWGRRLAFAVAMAFMPSAAAERPVAVVYPHVDQPASTLVYESIIAGINAGRHDTPLASRQFDATGETGDLPGWLKSLDPKATIALGLKPELILTHSIKGRVVLGGSDLSPDIMHDAVGISLSVHPVIFFEYLKKLFPDIRRAFVVHEEKDRWLIKLARAAASDLGVEIVAYEAHDYASGAQYYRKILDEVEPRQDALWLPINSKRLDRGRVLPWLIEESWVKRFVIFSNSFEEVRLGATFGLYPDPLGYGRRLVELAEDRSASGIEPARAVRSAVQIRFARHLEANLPSVQFDIQFPVQ